ncbi:MAG TPA: sugar-binding protein [Polyangia bacterium]|nr:sugar-binding protein [Polyangia bacterium]
MQRFAVAMLLVCAGCKFSIDALQGIGTVAEPDLAVGGSVGDDLATGAAPADLATTMTTDLSMPPPPDLVPDPCAGAPALGTGNVAAQCVIGDAPTIDGNLADWPLAQFLPMTKTTAAQANGTWDTSVPNDANSSARFFVRWDMSYLYVAVSIADDIRNTPNTGAQISENDAIEIFVDGQHDRSTSYSSDDWQLVYSADGQKIAAQGTPVAWPAQTKEAWSATSPAWTLEAAIPWAIMGGTPAALGRVVGFDLKLDDNDSGSTRQRDLILYYNAGPGGGQCVAPNCRADAFGTVQLQGR